MNSCTSVRGWTYHNPRLQGGRSFLLCQARLVSWWRCPGAGCYIIYWYHWNWLHTIYGISVVLSISESYDASYYQTLSQKFSLISDWEGYIRKLVWETASDKVCERRSLKTCPNLKGLRLSWNVWAWLSPDKVWRPARILRGWDSRPRCPRISVVWRPART